MFKRMTIFGLLLVILLTTFFVPSIAMATPSRSPMAACSNSMWLQPMERPGKPWEQHRHWLEASSAFNNSRYVIINMRTYKAYSWAFWGNDSNTNHAKFGVSTTWAAVNPLWKNDPWLLYYDCQ